MPTQADQSVPRQNGLSPYDRSVMKPATRLFRAHENVTLLQFRFRHSNQNNTLILSPEPAAQVSADQPT